VKNTLATVQSLAMQSFRDLDDASRSRIHTFEQRLFALSKVHDVLTRENWEGAELRKVLTEVIGPYLREGSGRIGMEGPSLWLDPRTTLSLSMAVHELATNAAKYGALSVPAGRVTITWTVAPGDPDVLTFRWQEQGGPVVSSPTRRGFGTRLIERSLAQDLGGNARLIYDPGGVACVVTAPLTAGRRIP
jgi:two-component sensor histidine kinase